MRNRAGAALGMVLVLATGCAQPPDPLRRPDPQRRQQPPSQSQLRQIGLSSGEIRVSIPKAWKVERDEPRGTGHLLLVTVPFPAAAGTRHASQVILSTTKNSGVADVRAYAAWSLRELVEKNPAAVIAGSVEGASWFTVMSRARQDGLGYVVIDRFGVSPGFLANLRVTIPLIAHAPLSWFETTIPQFNELIRSFTMGGSNASRSELVIEEGHLALRAINPNRPLKSPFKSEPGTVLLRGSPPKSK